VRWRIARFSFGFMFWSKNIIPVRRCLTPGYVFHTEKRVQ
jgi:hypothetical protein